ncbi:MAG: cytidylyltransferase domain-containing protein [Brevefilum sp.]
MVSQSEVLALIPARGGSKGILRKNIRDFAGHPLIAYSIAAGLQAGLVNRVVVSTDDPEIAEIAKAYGAELPFLRPAELARDETLDLPVFEHALEWFKEHENYEPDFVVQLRPTSPIRPKDLVDRGIELLKEHPEADSVRGVVPAGQNPYKMWSISQDGKLKPLLTVEGIDEPFNAPRQSLPKVFWQTGHIDVIRSDVILRKGSMTGENILPLHIDPSYTVDIDTLRDWTRYELLVRENELDMVYPGKAPRPWPERVSLVVFDFDGVMTDDRVWVTQSGQESIAANRSDGMGIEMLLDAGFSAVIISTESNPVVAARAKKLGLPYFHGVGNKSDVLKVYLEKEGFLSEETIYVGNDVNDLPCFPVVACAIAVGDAHHMVRRQADQVLKHPGGHGAVREICDILLDRYR